MNVLKKLLSNKIDKIKELGFVNDKEKITESGQKEMFVLMEICHDIMKNESGILDSPENIGRDTFGIFTDAIKYITGEDDVTLLAFLYNERENNFKFLRATLEEENMKKQH